MKTSQKFLLLLGALILVSGIILATNPISDADQNKAENKENNLAISSPTFIDKELYAVGKYYKSERLVDHVSKSLDNQGNGYFYIVGPDAAPYDTLTTRASLNFGFNNPYYKNSGEPVSYTVKCKISYDNSHVYNIDGSVGLYVLLDDGEWFEIFEQHSLDQAYFVDLPVDQMLSDECFRDDGSTDFKIVGQSVAYSELLWWEHPSVTVRITNLHVVLTYDIDNLFPVEEVYAIGQEYNDEVLVDTLSQYNDNMGNGGFAIEGILIDFPSFPTPPLPDLHNKNPRASLTFGVNNPRYVDEGRPDPYTVKFSIRYFHWDNDGNVVLYVLRDDGAWVPIFEKYGLGLGFGGWLDQSWTDNSFEYLRADGYMQFKLVAQSNTDTDGVIAGCSVTIEDLRVELVQEDRFPIEEIYTVGQYYKTETGVESIVSKSLDNMGNGHFHIDGYLVIPAGALSTTRARLNFGFSNPYYENSGASDSYTVKCTIKYDNGDDRDGYVKLYVQDDQANWHPIWQKTGLSSTDETWFDVKWTNNSDEYYRDDGSMNFKIVGQSQDSQDNILVLRVPSVRVEIYNLRVQLNYASDDLFPKDGVSTVGQYYKTEKESGYFHIDVEEIGSQSLDNTGNGHFLIRGQVHYGGNYYSGTRARLNFGFNNPYYGDYGAPDSYTINCTITYSNNILPLPFVSENANEGYVKLCVQRDDGEWIDIWRELDINCYGGWPAEEKTWPVEICSTRSILQYFGPDKFYRDDGSMNFKVVGESGTITQGDTPTCYVKIEDLSVKVYYKPKANAGGPYYGNEGSPVTLDASDSFDLNGDLQYRWDFNNDGIWDTSWSDSPTIEHTWFDDYSGAVRVKVSNSFQTDTAIASITVVNVDPILDGLSATSINEGSICTLSATIVDPSNLDTFLVTIDWGDGSPIEEFNYDSGITSISEIHTYPDDNPSGTSSDDYTIKITIEDDDSIKYSRIYAFYQSFTPEINVFDPVSIYGGNNLGGGNFDIWGFPCELGDTSTTRARLNFGFINPYYDNSKPPDSYEVKCRIQYTNSIFDYGYVKLYVQDDQADWIPIWGKTNLEAAETWDVSWMSCSDEYYRDDGSMQFKIVGQSSTGWWGDVPRCIVIIEDLHVVYLSPIIITVSNVAPTLGGLSATSVDEGEFSTLSGTINDPGILDTYVLTVDWGDGSSIETFNYPAGTTSFNEKHQYLDDRIYTITLSVEDDDGGVGTEVLDVEIYNVAPVPTITGPLDVDEGATYTLSIEYYDPGADIIQWEINWGDGAIESYSGDITSLTHEYTEGPLSHTITATVTDDDGGVGTDTLTITVSNVAPSVYAGSGQTVEEGDIVTFSGSFSDPGTDNTHTIEWDFGDGDIATGTLTPTHEFGDDGIYTVTLTVTDDNGGVGMDTLIIFVQNVAPSVCAGTDQTVDEGENVSFFGSFDDPGTVDTHTFKWDFGDGNIIVGILTQTHVYEDNGEYTVTLTVTDKDGGIGTDTVTISVNNVAPTILTADDRVVEEDKSYLYSWVFIDPGILDTHTSIIDWGDGTTPESGVVSEDQGEGRVTASHIYLIPSPSYIISITVEDNDGGIITATFLVEVLDKTPPDTAIDLDGIMGDNGWYVSDVIVTLTATDEYSGIYSISYTFGTVNVEVSHVDSVSFVISDEGTMLLSYYSVDTEGNVEETKEITLFIDKTAPTTILTIGEPNYGSDPMYITTDTEFTLEAIDNLVGSGVKEIKYQIDSNGWLTYTTPFTIDDFGTHTVYYYSIDMAGNEESVESILVELKLSEISYTGEICGNYSDPVNLEAKLTDMATRLPIPDKFILFEVGDQFILAQTDMNGIASATIILTQPGGLYTVSATFEGDQDYQGSTDSSDFTLEKEHLFLRYTGYSVVPTTADTIELRATIFEDDDGYWGNLNYIYVTFTIYSVPMDVNSPLQVLGPYMVEFTNVDGIGVATVEIPNLPENGYLIKVSLTPNLDYYHQGEDSDLAILTVYLPTGDFVTGGGWIVDSNGKKGNFGFNVKYKKNGAPKGQAIYVYREGDWEYIIKSNAWIGMAIIGNHSVFEAKCVVQQYNSKTGELLWGEGNYRMQVNVWDGKEDGNTDVYQIRVYDKDGVIYHQAGYDPYGYLMGGNIVIHIDKKK